MGFGSRLLEVRKSRGFSQAELADLLNTKPPVIGRYEREEATPSVEVELKLAKILGVSLDYLVGHTDLELDKDALIRDYKTQKAYA